MRIYLYDLSERRYYDKPLEGGLYVRMRFPARGFYNAPDGLGRRWVDDGVAFEATSDNKVRGFRPGESSPRLVDFDAGGTLDGLYSQPQPLPTAEDEVVEAAEPEVDESEVLASTDDEEEVI